MGKPRLTVPTEINNWKIFLLVAAASLVHDRIHAIVILLKENRIHKVPSWMATPRMRLFLPVLGLTIDLLALTALGAQFFFFPWQSALITALIAIAISFLVTPFFTLLMQRILKHIALELLVNLIFFGLTVAIFFWH